MSSPHPNKKDKKKYKDKDKEKVRRAFKTERPMVHT